MPPPWEVLRLGPFTGGLNTAADRSVVGDEELIECLNFELDIDGSLVQRPAIDVYNTGAVDTFHHIFGSVELAGTLYLFANRGGETFVSTDGTSWTELAPGGTNRECVTMAVYADAGTPTVWLPATPGSTGGGIKWTPGGGAVAVADMPRGSACVVHKNRLYICPGPAATSNESRLFFSDAGDFDTWTVGTDFIDVSQGDGTTLNNVIVYQDNLLIFKEDSTFVLAYDLDPVDAILREINPVVGSQGSFGVTQHENTVYALHNANVYAIVNYTFELLNLKVPLEFEDSLPTGATTRFLPQHLSLLGDRLIVRYYNKTYAFNIRTQTWGEWMKTDGTHSVEWHIFAPLIRGELVSGLDRYAYYTSYSFTMNNASGYRLIKIVDGRTTTQTEGFGTHTMNCVATTKDYDMADPVRYKRLFWWGADLLSGNDIVADVEPITLSFVPTWGDLGNLQWEDLETWGNPTMSSLPTTTEVDGDGNFATNRMVKFRKSLRFRKVNFSVMLTCDGSSLEPTKIFSYIAIVRTKQLVSKESS
jgi:hypothetical protein